MLSTKDLVFKEQLAKSLRYIYIEPYIIKEIVLANTIKLRLLKSIRIYLVVNISRVARYRKPIERQKIKKPKIMKVDRFEEQKIEKILNKKIIGSSKVFGGVEEVYSKVQYIGKKKLKNTKKVVVEFKRRIMLQLISHVYQMVSI